MSKLTKEFVEGFLERYDGDLSGPILDLADGGNPAFSVPRREVRAACSFSGQTG